MQSLPIIAFVETRSVGHYPEWVRAIAEAFLRLNPACRLHVWLPRGFRSLHCDWAEEYFSATENAAVRFACYDSLFATPPGAEMKLSTVTELDIILRCVEQDNACVCYIGRLDGQLKNLAFGRFSSMRAKLVGLMDQPYLHYGKISNGNSPAWFTKAMLVKGFLVNVVAAHRRALGRILMGDPLAPAFHRRVVHSNKYRFLPEPFSAIRPSPFPRRHLNLPENRILLLFIGGTERRKGICELLSALEAVLHEKAELRDQIAFVLAGRVIDETRETVHQLIARLRCDFPNVPFPVHDGLLTGQEYVDYLTAADLVCMPYLNMIGTSGVLAHAVHAGRLVLSSNFGITGELVRRYKLGVACNTSDDRMLQSGLVQAIKSIRDKELTQEARKEEFLRDCTVSFEQLGETIVRHLTEVGGIQESDTN
jgi:glycosyltransferase involved in cell wall biosynthesis